MEIQSVLCRLIRQLKFVRSNNLTSLSMYKCDTGLYNMKDEFLQINLSHIYFRMYMYIYQQIAPNNIKKGYESYAEIVDVNKTDKTLLNLQ